MPILLVQLQKGYLQGNTSLSQKPATKGKCKQVSKGVNSDDDSEDSENGVTSDVSARLSKKNKRCHIEPSDVEDEIVDKDHEMVVVGVEVVNGAQHSSDEHEVRTSNYCGL